MIEIDENKLTNVMCNSQNYDFLSYKKVIWKVTHSYFSINKFENIEYLDLSYTGIMNLNDLKYLKLLKTFNCSHNCLMNLNGIHNFQLLEHLNCDYNLITSLENIETLTNLQTISFKGNNIYSLFHLFNLSNLRDVEFDEESDFDDEDEEFFELIQKRKECYLIENFLNDDKMNVKFQVHFLMSKIERNKKKMLIDLCYKKSIPFTSLEDFKDAVQKLSERER